MRHASFPLVVCAAANLFDQLLISIVDLHSLTSTRKFEDATQLRNEKREMAISLLACGIDPNKCILYNQSDVSGVAASRFSKRLLDPRAGVWPRRTELDSRLYHAARLAEPHDAVQGLYFYMTQFKVFYFCMTQFEVFTFPSVVIADHLDLVRCGVAPSAAHHFSVAVL